MKLNLRAAFESILRSGKGSVSDYDQPASIVLLIREARFPSLDGLRRAAEDAFGVSFSSDKQSQHFVAQVTLFTLMKAGPHVVSFLNYTKRYDDGSEFLKRFVTTLPKESQRRAWKEHSAWMAVNYAKGVRDVELQHCVLAKLCTELISDICTGVYIPKERLLIPYDGSTKSVLHELAAARPLGVM